MRGLAMNGYAYILAVIGTFMLVRGSCQGRHVSSKIPPPLHLPPKTLLGRNPDHSPRPTIRQALHSGSGSRRLRFSLCRGTNSSSRLKNPSSRSSLRQTSESCCALE